MTPSFPEIINSRLFKFIVGEKSDGIPTEFFVYEEAIARLSKPLETLVKGGLSEAQAGCTIWNDVSKETFERFVQVAYTGDYSIPNTRECIRVTEPEKVGGDSTSELKESEEKPAEEYRSSLKSKIKKKGKGTLGGWRSSYISNEVTEAEPELELELGSPILGWGSITRKKRDGYLSTLTPSSSSLFTAKFHSLQYPLLAPRNIHDCTCEPAVHFEPNRSYSNVFLAHASLYILGDYWLIDSLKALALHKLHKTLCVFQLEGENIDDVVDLARYAYSEGKGVEEGIGRLRAMVCQYMALNAAVLSPHTGFTDLLADGGEFAKDFFKFAIQRMQ